MENVEQKYEEEIKQLEEEIERCEAEREECLRAIARQHGGNLQNMLWVAENVSRAELHSLMTTDPLVLQTASSVFFRKTLSTRQDREDEAINKDVSKLMTEISDLEKDHRRQADISGISLSECWVKTLEKSKRLEECIRRDQSQNDCLTKCKYVRRSVKMAIYICLRRHAHTHWPNACGHMTITPLCASFPNLPHSLKQTII